MKVTNNKIGPSTGKLDSAKLDSAKSGKAEGAKGLLDSGRPGEAVKAKNLAANNVDVSERAQMMKKAKDIASDVSVDEAKVARLQKLIDEGKYKVDADAIADRLVDEHLNIPD